MHCTKHSCEMKQLFTSFYCPQCDAEAANPIEPALWLCETEALVEDLGWHDAPKGTLQFLNRHAIKKDTCAFVDPAPNLIVINYYTGNKSCIRQLSNGFGVISPTVLGLSRIRTVSGEDGRYGVFRAVFKVV